MLEKLRIDRRVAREQCIPTEFNLESDPTILLPLQTTSKFHVVLEYRQGNVIVTYRQERDYGVCQDETREVISPSSIFTDV